MSVYLYNTNNNNTNNNKTNMKELIKTLEETSTIIEILELKKQVAVLEKNYDNATLIRNEIQKEKENILKTLKEFSF